MGLIMGTLCEVDEELASDLSDQIDSIEVLANLIGYELAVSCGLIHKNYTVIFILNKRTVMTLWVDQISMKLSGISSTEKEKKIKEITGRGRGTQRLPWKIVLSYIEKLL